MDKISNCLLVHLTNYLDYKEIMRFSQVNKRTNNEFTIYSNYIWKSIIDNIKDLKFIQCKGYKTLNYPGYAITLPTCLKIHVKDMFINLIDKLKSKNIRI